jgi:hypothetical protein
VRLVKFYHLYQLYSTGDEGRDPVMIDQMIAGGRGREVAEAGKAS